MMKRINVKGIIILVSALLIAQLAVGLVISPLFTSAAVEAINAAAGTKVIVEKVHVWPVTLSFSLKGLKIFDPDDASKRMIEVKSASFRLSPWALLCKRVVFARIKADGVDIDLEGRPDGSFNIQKLSGAEGPQKGGIGAIWDRVRGGKDWFSRIYDIVKKRSSPEGAEKAKAEKAEGGKIVKDVQDLPQGQRVEFKMVRDYLFEIKELDLKNTRVHLVDGQSSADIDKAAVRITGVAFDPDKGARLRSVSVRGRVFKDGELAGDLKLEYSSVFTRGRQVTDLDLVSRDLDLAAVKFIYDDSLPLDIVKGRLDLNSKTSIRGEAIDSRNRLVLKDHEFAAKMGKQVSAGAIAGPVLVEALNGVNPVKLNFDITGTVDKPEFGGLQESLNELLKPYVEKIGKNLEKQGMNAVQKFFKKDEGARQEGQSGSSEDSSRKTLNSIKTLFGGEKQEGK